MHTPWRRFLPGCLGLLYLALPACMQVPLCIPEVNYVAPIDSGAPSNEVHAFRVDVRQREIVNIDDDFNAEGGGVAYYQLSPMALSSGGMTSTQLSVSCAYGLRFIGIWNHWPTLTTHSVAVRLYRRGYATTELRPGQDAACISWNKVYDSAAYEKAVDDLLGVSPLDSTSPLMPLRGTGRRSPPALELGTRSSSHREALLFAAAEYEWLSHQASSLDAEDQALRNRLAEKVGRLKDLAQGKVPEEPDAKGR